MMRIALASDNMASCKQISVSVSIRVNPVALMRLGFHNIEFMVLFWSSSSG